MAWEGDAAAILSGEPHGKAFTLVNSDLAAMLPIFISNPAERRSRIAAATTGVVADHWVTLRQGPRQVCRAPLAQELLLYRVDNGRLLARLHERLAHQPQRLRQLAEQESEPGTQELLHELLVEKARDPKGPILQELERLAVQTEPLLVDADGVVVNGNRRLAAMRWLLAVDAQRFARFQQPMAAVLPPEVERADLEFIEAALQMAPETKLAYGWLDRRLKLREQREQLGLADAWIVEAYRMDEGGQVERELAELALAEVSRTPLRYSAIDDAETLFCGLAGQLATLPRQLARPWRGLGLLLIDQRAQLDPGLAKHFPFAEPTSAELAPLVLRRLAQEWGLEETDGGGGGAQTEEAGASGALGPGPERATPQTPGRPGAGPARCRPAATQAGPDPPAPYPEPAPGAPSAGEAGAQPARGARCPTPTGRTGGPVRRSPAAAGGRQDCQPSQGVLLAEAAAALA